MKRNYNNDIYKMYEEEVAKNEKANETIKSLKLEIYALKADLKQSNNKIDNAINKATATLKEENQKSIIAKKSTTKLADNMVMKATL